jgi:hypothetical protein
MGCDMVVALGQATANGQTLFGLNCHGPRAQGLRLRRHAGQMHAPGSVIRASAGVLPQARRTYTVLGCGARGPWGLTHGLNEHKVAMGMATWSSRVISPQPGLEGAELVRLTLERSQSACQAQEVLTDLITRYGQGQGDAAEGRDHIFLIADPREALVVEAAGSFWATTECQQVRAVSDTVLIRQDWQRVAPGLVKHAIAMGWWRDDGSKIDFSGSLGAHPPSQAPALKRWGRASLLLEQQNGHIDAWFLRRMLAEHFESTLRPPERLAPALTNTFLTALSSEPDAVGMAWYASGPPGQAVYFPVLIDGELPVGSEADSVVEFPPPADNALKNREELDKWQTRLDQRAEDFCVQGRLLKKQGNNYQLQRQASLFMAQNVHGFEAEPQGAARRLTVPAEDLAYIAE